jgi:adenosine deaminase
MEREKQQAIRENLLQIPKTEIHLHLEGLASVDTVWKLIQKHDISISGISTKDDLIEKYNIQSLDEFITLFINIIQSCFREISDFDFLLDDAAAYLSKNNIVYAELFFAPSSFLLNGISFDHMMERLHSGSQKIEKEHGIKIRFLIDVSRTFGLDNAKKNVEMTIANKCESIIGIGLGGSEKKGPARDFKSVFDIARENDLHVVAHAGEDVGPESVWDAATLLKSERIGHGISAIYDKKLMDYLAEHQIPLEICPTSNIFTRRFVSSYADHPIKPFYDHGINVTVNTDDPAIFNIDLIDEYINLMKNGLFTLEETYDLIRKGAQATFLPEKEKNKLVKKIEKQLKKYS